MGRRLTTRFVVTMIEYGARAELRDSFELTDAQIDAAIDYERDYPTPERHWPPPGFTILHQSLVRPYDQPEPQRVNRWLAQAGVCSRREAEALIAAGLVSIDGEVVADPGRKIGPGQTLTLADRGAERLAAAFTAVVNKPAGYVSAQPEAGQVPAARLLTAAARWGAVEAPAPARDASLAPLGRLDQDSHGLLLLSDDGVLAKALIGPESDLEKEYLVRVAGPITEAALARLRHGLHLDGRALRQAKVTTAGEQRLRFILKEGRKRQIRRMCELVDLAVTDLYRLRIGPLKLGDLPEGRWRPLAPDERAALLAGARRKNRSQG